MARPLVPEPKVLAMPWTEEREVWERYAACFAGAPPGRVLGEKSSQYLYLDGLPETVARLLPEARVVFTLREPIARAYSQWAWNRRNGLEERGFEEAVAASDPDDAPVPDRPWIRPRDYLLGARYAELARRWLDPLGDRVCFVLFEDLLESPPTMLALQEFLAIEPHDLGPLPSGLDNETASATPALDPGVHARLRERLRPAVQDLAEVTGLDVARWVREP